MKKAFTFFAAMVMLASVSFAQGEAYRLQPGERANVSPSAAFKASLRNHDVTTAALKAVGDTVSTFPWIEDFESGVAPTGFSFIDADADGFNWDYTYLYTDGDAGHNNSTGMVASASYDNQSQSALTPDNWMILPTFVIPAGATDYKLTWYEKGQDINYAAENYSVYISTVGNSVANFTATTAVYNGLATGNWVKRTVDLGSYAGQTIHIAFRHHNVTDMFYLDIDDIRIGGPEPPMVTLAGPSAVIVRNPATYVATSDESSFSWFVDGVSINTTGNTMTTTFDSEGMHQVVVSVSNNAGTASDTMDVDVFSCDNITLPYTPNFHAGLGCWDTVCNNTHGTGWFASVDMFSNNPEGQVISISAQNYMGFFMSDIPVDNWLVSPEIEMPTTGTYEISWKVKPYYESYDGDHYGVYVINGSDTTLLLEESLTDMAFYNHRVAVIPSTVSGNFRVAFRHFNSEGGYVIVLDSIQIRNLTVPEINITGPTSIESGIPATYRVLCGNAESYNWTIDGTPVNTNGNVTTTTFTVDGYHTVAVTATNSVGSSTDSIVTEVYTCNAISDFPYVQTFENGYRCWSFASIDSANDDRVGIDTMHYAGNYGFRFSSFSSASDYNQYLFSPELNLPATEEYMVKFVYKGYNARESFRVLASSTDMNITSFTDTIGNCETTSTQWTEVAFRLPAGTKYFAINYYGNFEYYLYVDNISVENLSAPLVTVSGPAIAEVEQPVTFTADAPLATSFIWSVDGNTANTTGNTLTTSFATAGDHTVSVMGVNSVGTSAPAATTINIYSCDANTEFPWVMDFESATGYDCWRFIDADGDGFNWNTNYLRDNTDSTGNYLGHNGSHGLVGSASWNNSVGALTPDNWMILPGMSLPEGSEYVLTWFEKGQDKTYFAEKYSVYISTQGRNIEDFTTPSATFTAQNRWVGRNIELGQYAGQTIYIAFRHYDCTDMFYLDIDDIKISTEHVGIDNVENATLNLYPNPANTTVTVNAEGIEGNVNVQVVDLNGRVMIEQNGAAQSFRFDVSRLAQGAYFVRMTGENISVVRKLIVK